jgi:hypothetical protein
MTHTVDQQAMALGVQLREQSPGGRLLANTSMLTPLDWYVLRPGQRHGLEALLEASHLAWSMTRSMRRRSPPGLKVGLPPTGPHTA